MMSKLLAPRILILCTGNSCRSQMAAEFLRSLDANMEVDSAGTEPASRVHPLAVQVMKEAGRDIAGRTPLSVEEFLHRSFDYVITVCDNARETCPVFTGRVTHRLHMGFPDPAAVVGSPPEVLNAFRTIRDSIRETMTAWYRSLPTSPAE
jgi:arsenate reductase (thioredoxin)